jgi:hypothetical protein
MSELILAYVSAAGAYWMLRRIVELSDQRSAEKTWASYHRRVRGLR